MAHVSQAKKVEFKELKHLFKEHSNFGIINITNLPSFQLQKIKSKLKEIMIIKISKKRLIKLAILELKDEVKNLDQLLPYLEDCAPAILFTKESPFKIARILDKNKSSAPAKPGSVSPKDITIPAGPTNFPPGPIIGELGQAGIKATLEAGKVTIKEDKLIVKKGEIISKKVSDILARFSIEPMEIGLNLTAFYENTQIYPGDVLSVDEKTYIDNIKLAYIQAESLAINISYPIKETIKKLIAKAYLESKSISTKTNISTESISEQIAEATKIATTVEDNLPEAQEETTKSEGITPKIEATKSLLVEYTEEDSKKAQEFLEDLKDRALIKSK